MSEVDVSISTEVEIVQQTLDETIIVLADGIEVIAAVEQGVPGLPGERGLPGAVGPMGPEGPAGASSSRFFYRVDGNSQAPNDPGAGKLRWNASPMDAATSLYVDSLTQEGFDPTAMFKSATFADEIIIQDKDIAASFQKWKIIGEAISYADWFEVPVEFISFSGPTAYFSHNQEIAVLLRTRGEIGPPGPKGDTGEVPEAPVNGLAYGRKDAAWAAVNAPTAQSYNRIVNPAMQVSQENGDNNSTVAWWPADQWYCQAQSSGQVRISRYASTTPNGSTYRARMYIEVADTSLAAGEFSGFRQVLEGLRITDFRYGFSNAKQSILRFGFRSPAGTYSIRLMNKGANRTYVQNFTISAGQANTDTEQIFIIPGDTTGALWNYGNDYGIYLDIIIACGSSFVAPGVGWHNANYMGTAANTNGLNPTGFFAYELFDVGLYLDPTNTGIPPRWEAPDPIVELQKCRRYLTVIRGMYAADYTTGAGGVVVSSSYPLPTPMRITPTLAFANVGYSNASTLITGAALTTDQFYVVYTPGGSPGTAYAQFDAFLNARMA